MRAAKSYLAAHTSWFDENPDPTCPRCGTDPENFEHAILTCPARTKARDLLLKDVSSLGPDADLWTEPILLRALGEYITDTKSGFPLDMTPSTPAPLPSNPRDPISVPRRRSFYFSSRAICGAHPLFVTFLQRTRVVVLRLYFLFFLYTYPRGMIGQTVLAPEYFQSLWWTRRDLSFVLFVLIYRFCSFHS